MNKRMIVALLRVSSADQKKGHSLAGQKMTIVRYANNHGDNIDYFYDEQSRSAFKNVVRPEFDQMILDVKADKIKKIYVWKGDRLTRKFMLNEELHNLFIKHRVQLISLTEDINFMTADGRSTERKRAIDRQAESERTSERTKMGLDTSAYSGNYPKSIPKLGFKWKYESAPSPIIIDENVYDDILMIISKVVENKMGIPTLNKWLNANKYLNRRWTEDYLYHWLEDPILYGTFIDNFKKPTLKIENHSPALISKERFNEIQKIIHTRHRQRKYAYLFKGYIYCKRCDKILTVQPSKNHSGDVYLYYYCKDCNKRINESMIYNQLKNEFNGICISKDDQVIINQLEIKQNRIVHSLNDYNQLYISCDITAEQYKETCSDLFVSLEAIKNQRQLLEQSYALLFEHLTTLQQREFLKKYIKKIEITWDPKTAKAVKKE